MKEGNKIILYQDDNDITRVSVLFSDEHLWLTQNQLAEIYCTTQQNISQHIDNIYKDGELSIEATNKKFLLVRQEGNRHVKRHIDHYNLDMIIANNVKVKGAGFGTDTNVVTLITKDEIKELSQIVNKYQTKFNDYYYNNTADGFARLIEYCKDTLKKEAVEKNNTELSSQIDNFIKLLNNTKPDSEA